MKLIPKTDYKRSTWKNGLGFTDQIAIYPPDAVLAQANFLWRLSSAQIEKASPFSLFPAHDRMLLVLKGAGLKLTHTFEEDSEETVQLLPLEMYEFPGDVPSRCELIDGPITDFSIFLRTAEVEPLVQIVEIKMNQPYEWKAEGRWNFAFAISGDFETPAGKMNEGDTLSTESTKNISIHAMNSNAKMLLVCLV